MLINKGMDSDSAVNDNSHDARKASLSVSSLLQNPSLAPLMQSRSIDEWKREYETSLCVISTLVNKPLMLILKRTIDDSKRDTADDYLRLIHFLVCHMKRDRMQKRWESQFERKVDSVRISKAMDGSLVQQECNASIFTVLNMLTDDVHMVSMTGTFSCQRLDRDHSKSPSPCSEFPLRGGVNCRHVIFILHRFYSVELLKATRMKVADCGFSYKSSVLKRKTVESLDGQMSVDGGRSTEHMLDLNPTW